MDSNYRAALRFVLFFFWGDENSKNLRQSLKTVLNYETIIGERCSSVKSERA